MSVGPDRFQIMLVGEKCIGGSGKAGTEGVAHGIDHVLMPEKAVPTAGAEVADTQVRNTTQTRHLFPEPGLGAGIKNVEFQFAELFQAGAGLQFADLREREDLPHGGLGPEAMKLEIQLSIVDRQLIVGEPEITLQPFQKGRLEDAASSIECVAGEPDQFRPAKP